MSIAQVAATLVVVTIIPVFVLYRTNPPYPFDNPKVSVVEFILNILLLVSSATAVIASIWGV